MRGEGEEMAPHEMTSKKVENQYHQLVADGDYAKALDLVTHYFDLFPIARFRVPSMWLCYGQSYL
jgi:hypothetical protein